MSSNDIRIKHPAKYSDALIPLIAVILRRYNVKSVFDPMAGTGKIGEIRKYGFEGRIDCNDIEPDWIIGLEKKWDTFTFQDASYFYNIGNGAIDCICTSPTYANRLADHWNPKDNSKRFSYKFNIGRELHSENTGNKHWGKAYREKHEAIWLECYRILKSNGLLILNISNHIRGGKEIFVSEWHREILKNIGFVLIELHRIKTPRLRFGANSSLRVEFENLFVFKKS